MTKYDYVIVGAGFAGSTLAERLASQCRARVLVIDTRPHVGGNAYDPIDASGVRIHRYGPHIFHTSSRRVVDYLSRFTGWRPYEHRVLARVGTKDVPLPICSKTIAALYGLDLDDEQMTAFFLDRATPIENVRNSEDAIVSRIGRDLYETLFAGYTRKQWGLDPSELDASVCGRIPVRTNGDDRYFSDTFQAMPLDGFEALFTRMLDHPNIELALEQRFEDLDPAIGYDRLIYTGPIDAYFDYCYGALPYRSLRFEFETLEAERFQHAAVVNFPGPEPYTRISEFKYVTGQQHPRTTIAREYSSATGEPYYPIPRPENRELYARYAARAADEKRVTFVGRLAEYRYYNMDQAVASALVTFDDIARERVA